MPHHGVGELSCSATAMCSTFRLEQLASPLAFSPMPNSALDPCAKETVLSALKESRKRNVEDGDQSIQSSQDMKRR